MGRHRAGRLRLFGERPAPRHPAKGACRDRQFIERFFDSGLAELGDKLGPVLWQFPPFKQFDRADFAKFLEHLPENLDGRRLDHVVEVRHASFQDPAFIRLLRDHDVAPVFVDSEDYPTIADLTGEVVYARLQRGADSIDTGYAPEVAGPMGHAGKVWAAGGTPDDLPVVDRAQAGSEAARCVRLLYSRREAAGARRRHGVHRTPGPCVEVTGQR